MGNTALYLQHTVIWRVHSFSIFTSMNCAQCGMVWTPWSMHSDCLCIQLVIPIKRQHALHCSSYSEEVADLEVQKQPRLWCSLSSSRNKMWEVNCRTFQPRRSSSATKLKRSTINLQELFKEHHRQVFAAIVWAFTTSKATLLVFARSAYLCCTFSAIHTYTILPFFNDRPFCCTLMRFCLPLHGLTRNWPRYCRQQQYLIWCCIHYITYVCTT